MKVSKALQEVWEWKEKVYEEIKGMTPEEWAEYFNKSSEKILDASGYRKIPLGNGIYKITKFEKNKG